MDTKSSSISSEGHLHQAKPYLQKQFHNFILIKAISKVDVTSILIGVLFFYASLNKFNALREFQLQLKQSPFISQFAQPISWILPILEFGIFILVAFKSTRIIGFYLSLFLMTMFTAYIYAMLHFSYYIPCSCGGIISQMGWHSHLLFNLFFVLISGLGIIGHALETTQKYR